jgi:hypothetical protein
MKRNTISYRAWGSIVLTLLALPLGARAQAGMTVPRGARIRVVSSAAAAGTVVGSLVSLESDTLRMAAEPDSRIVVLPLRSVTQLEISQVKTHPLKYAGIGLLVGAGLGALFGAESKNDSAEWSTGAEAVAGAMFFGVLGTLGGLVIGSIGSEQWVQTDPASVHLAWQPDRGATLTASIHF